MVTLAWPATDRRYAPNRLVVLCPHCHRRHHICHEGPKQCRRRPYYALDAANLIALFAGNPQ